MPTLINHNMPVHTAATTSCTTSYNTHRRFFEESYVDAMEGRRSLRDVLGQIDGLRGRPSRRHRSSSEIRRRRPKRRRNVLVMKEEITDTQGVVPDRQELPRPCADKCIREMLGGNGWRWQ
jgi:hypothetical protein